MRGDSYFLTFEERIEIIKLAYEGVTVNGIARHLDRGGSTVDMAIRDHYSDAFKVLYPDKNFLEAYPRGLSKTRKRELANWLLKNEDSVSARVKGAPSLPPLPTPTKTTKPELVVINGQPPSKKDAVFAKPKPRFVRFAEWLTGYSA